MLNTVDLIGRGEQSCVTVAVVVQLFQWALIFVVDLAVTKFSHSRKLMPSVMMCQLPTGTYYRKYGYRLSTQGLSIGSGRGAFNNFTWTIVTRFSASGQIFEGILCSTCDKMTLTVFYFLNTGAKTRWCCSCGASAKFEKNDKERISSPMNMKLPQQLELMIMHLLIFCIIFLLFHYDDKAPNDDN